MNSTRAETREENLSLRKRKRREAKEQGTQATYEEDEDYAKRSAILTH